MSEIFPLEIRAQAIAVFFAIAQVIGAAGPWLFAVLVGDGTDPVRLFHGYLVAAAAMIAAGLVHARFGVEAARVSLEDVARPLSALVDR